jgi:Flp pilus assembly protein TadG
MKSSQSQSHCKRLRRAGAILSMELVLVLPLFLILIFAIVEFTMLMSARTRIGDVARHASRCMSISGCTITETEQLVHDMLGPVLARECVVQVEHGGYDGSGGNVRIDIPMSNAAPDLLWVTGFGLKGRLLSADAPMLMERDVASWQVQRL